MVTDNYQEIDLIASSWWDASVSKQAGHLRPQKNRKSDRHKLDRKTRYWRDFLKTKNYHLISLENLLQKNLLNGGREIYIALAINNKNCFFFKERGGQEEPKKRQKDYLFSYLFRREQKGLEEVLKSRPRRFRRKWKEIELKVEVLSRWDEASRLVPGYREGGRPKPSWEAVGWNKDGYREVKNRSLAALAFTQEVVLGKVKTSLLDLDPNKKDKEGNYKIKQEWLRDSLSVGGKKWQVLVNKCRLPYYWTTATEGNSLLPWPYLESEKGLKGKVYHKDTGAEVADLLGKGDLVALPVGADENRKLVITKWGWELVKKYGAEGIFKSWVLSRNKQEIKKILNKVFLTLGKPKKKFKVWFLTREKLKGNFVVRSKEKLKPRKGLVEAKILNKHKIPWLSDFVKIFYLNPQQQKNYFLLNIYQKPDVLPYLEIGSEWKISIVNGLKHKFFEGLIV
jgi:hypothetical protein